MSTLSIGGAVPDHEIEAGLSTLPTVLFAHLIYRWRQRRWRSLAGLVA